MKQDFVADIDGGGRAKHRVRRGTLSVAEVLADVAKYGHAMTLYYESCRTTAVPPSACLGDGGLMTLISEPKTTTVFFIMDERLSVAAVP